MTTAMIVKYYGLSIQDSSLVELFETADNPRQLFEENRETFGKYLSILSHRQVQMLAAVTKEHFPLGVVIFKYAARDLVTGGFIDPQNAEILSHTMRIIGQQAVTLSADEVRSLVLHATIKVTDTGLGLKDD